MIFKVICVGKLKDKMFEKRVQEYCKRLSFDSKVSITEIKDSTKEKEGQKLLELIDKEKGYVIALTEEGKELTSRKFSEKIASIHQKVTFVIGGPFGLTEEVKKRSDMLLSLSKMTFTHEMVRMFLMEQVYRAVSIMKGRKYHND